jgi:hypothetical protein
MRARRHEVGARSAKVSRSGSPRAISRTMSRRIASTAIAAIAVEYLKKSSCFRPTAVPLKRSA